MQRGLRVITLQQYRKVKYCYRNIRKMNDWMAPYLFSIWVIAITSSPTVH